MADMSRRLPIYLLMDCSGSVSKEALRTAADSLIFAFLEYPAALRCAHLSAIAFGYEANLLTPLTPLLDFQLPDFDVGSGGGADLGAALEALEIQARKEARKNDLPPWAFVLTDAKPADTTAYQTMTRRVRSGKIWGLQHIVACASSKQENPLRDLTDKALVLNDAGSFDIIQCIWDEKFLWENESLSANSDSVFTDAPLRATASADFGDGRRK